MNLTNHAILYHNIVINIRFGFMLEEYFDCPYCWENQLKMVDPSVKNQSFIEDCEVCCNPIDFHISIENNEVTFFKIEKIDQ